MPTSSTKEGPSARPWSEPRTPESDPEHLADLFNGKFRDELLDREIFYTLQETQVLIERWRQHDDRFRPHSSLGYRPPAPEAIEIGPLGMVPLPPAVAQGLPLGADYHGGQIITTWTSSDYGSAPWSRSICLSLSGFAAVRPTR